MTPCASIAGAAAYLEARKPLPGCRDGDSSSGEVCVCREAGSRADKCLQCGKTSSFVYGEVIGTQSLPGESTQTSILSLPYSPRPTVAAVSHDGCPPITRLSLSHLFLFPVWLPALLTHLAPVA